MQDESRTQGQPLVVSAARRRMDFAPVRSASRAAAPLPTDRELERRKLARQEMARREAIKHQIEEQNRLKNLNQRRIEAAKQELSEYQAAEEARNRALEGERQRILEHQRQAQREAAEQMAARRKAMELEAKKRLQAEQIRKQRALQEMQRREEASKIAASKRATLKPRQTTPFFAPSSAAGSATDSVTSSAINSARNSVAINSAVQSHTAPSSTVSNNTASLRPAGDTKVSASSRIQVIASPTRKLFGRIRPAGPTRQAQSESQSNFQPSNQLNSRLEPQAAHPLKTLADLDDDLFEDQLESEFSSSINVRRSTQPNRAKQVIKDDSDDLEDLLMSAFDEPSEKNPVKTTAKNPVKAPEYDRLAENLANNITQNTTQNTAQKTALRTALKISGNTSEKTSQKLDSTPDTSENNMNYILGGRSPFINTDKIIKRPLSDSTRENTARLDDQNEEESSSPVRPRKNVYEKRDHSKKSAKKTTTMIVEDRPKGIGISLAIAITLMIILGTIVGAFIYFAFFQ